MIPVQQNKLTATRSCIREEKHSSERGNKQSYNMFEGEKNATINVTDNYRAKHSGVCIDRGK